MFDISTFSIGNNHIYVSGSILGTSKLFTISIFNYKIEKQAYQLARMDSRKPVENCLK